MLCILCAFNKFSTDFSQKMILAILWLIHYWKMVVILSIALFKRSYLGKFLSDFEKLGKTFPPRDLSPYCFLIIHRQYHSPGAIGGKPPPWGLSNICFFRNLIGCLDHRRFLESLLWYVFGPRVEKTMLYN